MKILFTLDPEAVDHIAEGLVSMYSSNDLQDWPAGVRSLSELIYSQLVDEYIVAHYLKGVSVEDFSTASSFVTVLTLIEKYMSDDTLEEVFDSLDNLISSGNRLAAMLNREYRDLDSVEDVTEGVAYIIHTSVLEAIVALNLHALLPDPQTGDDVINTMPITDVSYNSLRRRLIITKEE